MIGHRLYREIRKVVVKKAKVRGSQVIPVATYQWETLAANLDEFQDVSVSCLSCQKIFFPALIIVMNP